MDTLILEMKQAELDIANLGERGAGSQFDPVQNQYYALATSIASLCQEPCIANTVVDYLKSQEDIVKRRKQGRSVTIADDLNSPALDTIIHATRNLI